MTMLEQAAGLRHSPAMSTSYDFRIGIDLGGTKTEIAALAPDGTLLHRHRTPTPPGYDDSVRGMAAMVQQIEQQMAGRASIGIGIPGVISPVTGLVKNANTIALNGHPFDRDIAALLGREVRVENDANCFALSEATDGAAAGAEVVFGVILGTGCGGGFVVRGQVLRGRNHIAGEWGHTPLPWPTHAAPPGAGWGRAQRNCLQTGGAGRAVARAARGPDAHDASALPARAAAGEARAIAALARHADRLARGLAVIVNVLDPDVIVLGGGLSNMAHLYEELPKRMHPHVFSDFVQTPIVKNLHGDSSGVRGAAWLWPAP